MYHDDSHPCAEVEFNGSTSTPDASNFLSSFCLSNSLDLTAIAGHVNFIGVVEDHSSEVHELNLSNIGNLITSKLLVKLKLD